MGRESSQSSGCDPGYGDGLAVQSGTSDIIYGQLRMGEFHQYQTQTGASAKAIAGESGGGLS
ncbi:hypothetical protein D3C87_2022190 [compost metagenome]